MRSTDMFPEGWHDYLFGGWLHGEVPYKHEDLFQEPWDTLEEKEDDDR